MPFLYPDFAEVPLFTAFNRSPCKEVIKGNTSAAIAELEGEGVRQVLDAPPIERAYNRAQIAELLGVSVKTVGSYVRRGLLTKILPGVNGQRATGYTGESVRKLLEGLRSA